MFNDCQYTLEWAWILYAETGKRDRTVGCIEPRLYLRNIQPPLWIELGQVVFDNSERLESCGTSQLHRKWTRDV